MKYIGFQFGSIEVEIDGVAFDLHNQFDFREINYDIESQRIDLYWNKNKYASQEDPESIILSFIGVSHFSSIPREDDVPFSEDVCVESIGFVGKNEKTENFYIMDNPTEDLHCVIAFHSGFTIRIFAETVECAVNA